LQLHCASEGAQANTILHGRQIKALKIGRRGTILLIPALWEVGGVLYISNGVFLAAGQKGKEIDMQKYLLIQIYVTFPHQKNFININCLNLDGKMKSEGILCGFHRTATRLTKEISTPLSSPPEIKAMVTEGCIGVVSSTSNYSA